MDITHRAEDDFCSVRGFLLSVRDTLRIKRGGLLWCGHPCNPFLEALLYVSICMRAKQNM